MISTPLTRETAGSSARGMCCLLSRERGGGAGGGPISNGNVGRRRGERGGYGMFSEWEAKKVWEPDAGEKYRRTTKSGSFSRSGCITR